MTYRDQTVGLVIPAHNEEPFVGSVVEETPSFVDRVYPVDDCSTDATWDVIESAATRVNRRRSPTEPYDCVVEPLQHDENAGAGAAVLTGYEAALDDGVDVVATMDGDGQMDHEFLSALLDPVIEGDVAYAKGNRLAGIDHVADMSAWRLFGNALLTGLTRISSGYWRLRDPQNGFTAVSSDALRSIDLDRLYERYGFLNDMLVQLNVVGVDVADVSHPANYGDETSGIQYLSFVPNLSWLLLRRFWWRLKQQARRDGDHAALTAFVGGIVSFVVALAERTDILGSTADWSQDEVVPEHPRSRTDGGVQRTTDEVGAPTLLVACVLLCLGMVFDLRERHGRVIRLDGEPRHDKADSGGD
jgi:glycosyltransferase involved in cell wall biosynthesis